MSLIAAQWEFAQHVAMLIAFAKDQGFTLTFGEVWRSPEQQALYVKTGRSKTMASMHLDRLAVDFNVFKDGKLCTRDEIAPLGRFWEDLHPKNRWGGSWKGLVESGRSKFIDAPHFERQR